ncbi:hypothetical protein GCK32_008239, partial [Trichostrongylus colubriformis]
MTKGSAEDGTSENVVRECEPERKTWRTERKKTVSNHKSAYHPLSGIEVAPAVQTDAKNSAQYYYSFLCSIHNDVVQHQLYDALLSSIPNLRDRLPEELAQGPRVR